ncbi:hypothetical protein GCM10023084_37390 [Streptomyces lacrimifluminis]|uniref:Uncharacterized protein n=1 Tax=Streptomyces lacrimifluminis TaxID=1500077 RepID=A0A917L0D3_9ACTN|nr:hypothetical protein GCM10012282_36560 [Streptomyces lacrimifluminis]
MTAGGALLFARFWRQLLGAVPSAQRWKVPFSAADPVGTPNTLNTDAPGFTRALADAVTELRAAGIPLNARLGDHQYLVRKGQRLPVGSGTESLGVWNKIEPVWTRPTAVTGTTRSGPATSRPWAGTAAAARWPARC